MVLIGPIDEPGTWVNLGVNWGKVHVTKPKCWCVGAAAEVTGVSSLLPRVSTSRVPQLPRGSV